MESFHNSFLGLSHRCRDVELIFRPVMSLLETPNSANVMKRGVDCITEFQLIKHFSIIVKKNSENLGDERVKRVR